MQIQVYLRVRLLPATMHCTVFFIIAHFPSQANLLNGITHAHFPNQAKCHAILLNRIINTHFPSQANVMLTC